MSYRRCAAKTCFNTHNCRANLKFFNFPKNETSCHQWVVNCGRNDFLDKTVEQISKFVLCADHFEEEYFINPKYKTLFKRSVIPIPTIFRNNLADFVPKSLQKNCEALNIERIEPLEDFHTSEHTLIYSENQLETFIYQENDQTADKINVPESSLASRVFSIAAAYTQNVADQLPAVDTCHDFPESCHDQRDLAESCHDQSDLAESCHDQSDLAVSCQDQRDLTESCHNQRDLTEFMGCHRMCRLCARLVHEDALVSVFFVDDSDGQTLAVKLDRMLPVKVSEEDGLPQVICTPCVGKLKRCDDMITSFMAADSKLRDLFLHESTAVHEIELLIETAEDADSTELSDFNETELKTEELFPTDTVAQEAPESPSHQTEEIVVDPLYVANMTDDMDMIDFPSGFCDDETQYVYLHADKNTLLLHEMESRPKSLNRKREMQTCDHCGDTFLGMKPLKRHIKMNHIPAENICQVCGARFKRKYTLDLHVRLHTNEKPYACPLTTCDKSFTFKSQLKLHKVDHGIAAAAETIAIKCDVCHKEFASKVNLWRHKRVHKKKVACLCCQCGKVLSNPTSLRVHMRTHTVDQPCACSVCNRPFKDPVLLAKHQASHAESKTFPCEVCGRLFYNRSLVRQHYQTHSEVKPYKCEICNTAFNRLGNLNQHIKKHTNQGLNPEPQYECLICGKRVKSELTLKYHLAKHTGEKKPFDCEICGKRFIAADPYRIHMRLHTGERPFSCGECGKSFRSLSTMKQHAALHLDEHPHPCPYCDRRFKRLQSLIVHKRTHTGEKNFKCPTCDRAFAQKGDMIKHTKTHMRNRSVFTATDQHRYINVLRSIDHISDLALSDSDITSEYLIDMPIVEVETEIQSSDGN